MAQDFWASSGFPLLRLGPEGLEPTDAWVARFLEREELLPPPEAGPRERALHARLRAEPRAPVSSETLAALEDPDARENWGEFLRFRERLLAQGTLERCYADLGETTTWTGRQSAHVIRQAIACTYLFRTAVWK